jgi:hypothetical protein
MANGLTLRLMLCEGIQVMTYEGDKKGILQMDELVAIGFIVAVQPRPHKKWVNQVRAISTNQVGYLDGRPLTWVYLGAADQPWRNDASPGGTH